LYLLSGVKKTAEKVLGTTAQVVGILAGGKYLLGILLMKVLLILEILEILVQILY